MLAIGRYELYRAFIESYPFLQTWSVRPEIFFEMVPRISLIFSSARELNNRVRRSWEWGGGGGRGGGGDGVCECRAV